MIYYLCPGPVFLLSHRAEQGRKLLKPDKMAGILNISGCISFKYLCFFSNTIEICLGGSVDNMSSLVQTMAWHQTCYKPFTEPVMN